MIPYALPETRSVYSKSMATESEEGVPEGVQSWSDEEVRLEKEHLEKIVNAFLYYKYTHTHNIIYIIYCAYSNIKVEFNFISFVFVNLGNMDTKE